MSYNLPVILASASSRRVELLSHLLPNFDKIPADIDETINEYETPHEYVARLAKQKAETVHISNSTSAVLGSDTIVLVDNHVLGKPASFEDSKAMLTRLSGNWHQVMTAVNIQYKNDAQEISSLSCLVTTDVEFCLLTEKEISDYDNLGFLIKNIKQQNKTQRSKNPL